MKTTVLDASVAIKWFVDEEKGRSAALLVLDQLRQKPGFYVVPELFFCEMLSVFCRIMNDPNQISRCLHILQDLGIERVGLGRSLIDEAVRISKKYSLRGYDAVYAATASLMNGVWLTADAKAHKKIEALRISSYLEE